MSKQIQIPDIGSDEVTVTEVMVKVGDTITADQSIINVEGDKASMEVPAPEADPPPEAFIRRYFAYLGGLKTQVVPATLRGLLFST